MINKFIVSKDNKYYRAFTDLININNRLICSFSEMNKETKECNICICESKDFGKSWSNRKILQEKIDDNPVAQIRGYSFYEKDLIIK